MIVASALSQAPSAPPAGVESVEDPGGNAFAGRTTTKSKQVVSPEKAKQIATVFRCMNGISDDLALMPFQLFQRAGALTEQIAPKARMMNLAYLLEVAPNRWMTPFILKKTVMMWLLAWGNGLIWRPAPPARAELFILPANRTWPLMDPEGNLWYKVLLPNGKPRYIPWVEVLHLMINSTNGLWGRGIIEYAAETLGVRQGMAETQSSIQGSGLNPAAYIQVAAQLDKKGREKYREAYSEVIAGAGNAGSLAVFDNKVVKFEPITMKMSDAQFLESINATDLEIANFFKYPAYKLNMGKQSYDSNDQQNLDYMNSTLDPYCVQWEQAARVRWLATVEQDKHYFRFIREAFLRMDAKKRAEIHEIEIRSGTLQPNEARAHNDRNSYPLGDKFWMTRNNAEIGAPEPSAPADARAPTPMEDEETSSQEDPESFPQKQQESE